MSATATTTQQFKQGTAKFWIVLVGVNRYLDSNILNLRYCANDCKELAEALEIATGEFQHTEIVSLHDGGNLPPERSQIIESIQQFRFAKLEDTVLFYFSGHGYLDSNNRPVLCVADTRLDNLAATGLKLDFLLNELSQCRAQRQLVWLDACQEREQQPDKQIKQNPTQQLSAALKEQAEKSKNFHGMLSCDKQERSWEIEELQHGLFTFCLIEGLRGKAANSKGQIDADGLFNYVERITSRIIEDKKNPGAEILSKGMMINVQQIKQSSPPPKTKRLPANASQTPKRIVQGGGELVFLIGLAAPINNRKALIIDRLSNSEANIGLCKLLQAQGNFAVEYRYLRDRQQWQLQHDISRYLAADNRTVLLYLSGTIESTADRGYELVCDSQHRINLSWLAKELQASLVKEIVLFANITKATENTPSLESILQLNYDLPLCLIEATSQSGDRQFLARLLTTLETAAKTEREFWVTDLISPLQKWSLEQPDIEVTGWWGTVGIIEILSVEVQRSDDRVFDIEVCPYKSLEAFSQNDAYFFHGREELITKIIEKLKSNSFLAVVGASGSGKSSVVRAGVVPRLVTNGLNTTSSQQTLTCKTWVMLPGENPFTALAKAIAPNEPELIEGVLHAGVSGFVDWLRQQPKAIYVLAIDQFEELFTLTPEKERIDFIRLIIAAVERAGDCFKVIITLRGDFINECLNLSEIAPLMEQNEILVPVKSSRLEDEQYRQIIAQPAQKVGLEVEDGLMAVLLEELKDGSLPLLQYALEELWQKRREGKLSLKDYQQHIGRLGQFLSDKAEATYQNLNQLQQECAQSVFLSLVYLAQEQDKTNKDTRRRLLKSDLRVNKYKDTLDDTLQALVDARLIVVSGEDNSSVVIDGDRTNALAVANKVRENTSDRNKDTIEIAHEILIDNWKTLKWWIDKNRDKYRLFEEIDRKAKDWKQNNQQEGFLLPKGALAKYEEFYGKYADELSEASDRFMDASIQARDKADKLAKRRQRQIIGGLTGGIVAISVVAGAALMQLRQATINEINALDNSTEALLASGQEFDALIVALKAGKQIKKNFFQINNETKIQLAGKIQNVFNRIKEANRLEGHTGDVERVKYSPNGQIIASISRDGTTRLWNSQGQLLHVLNTQIEDFAITKFDFSPNGQIVLVESENYNLNEFKTEFQLWDLQGELLQTLKSHNSKNDVIEFSPNGQTFASTNHDPSAKTISIWNLQGQLLYTLKGHTKEIIQVKFSPDGQTIVSTSRDGTTRLWNLQGQLLHTLKGHVEGSIGIYFNPDGQFFASVGWDQKIQVWNLQGQLLQTIETSKGNSMPVAEVKFSPDGQTIVSSSFDGTIRLWNLQGQLLHTLKGHTGSPTGLEFTPNGQIIVSEYVDEIKLWNLEGELLHTLEGSSFAFSPNGQMIAAVSKDKLVKLWNLEGKLLHTLEGSSFAFSPNGQNIISSSDMMVRLWNIEKEFSNVIKNNASKYWNIAFSQDGQTIASEGKDGTIKLWNMQGKLLHTLETNEDEITRLLFGTDGKTIASASGETVKLWNLQGQLLNTLKRRDFSKITFSPDSQTIAFIDDYTIELWNLKGQLLTTLKSGYNRNKSIVFSSDSQIIASAGRNTVQLWNRDGQLLSVLESHEAHVMAIAFSPDGQTVASGGRDKTIKLWNLQGKLLNTLKGHTEQVGHLKFSPDGQTIASATNSGYNERNIKLWNLKGELISSLQGHTDTINQIEFSPDSQTIASASDDETVKLWSSKGKLLHTFEGHTDEVKYIAFSHNGQTIASASTDKSIKLWNLNLDETMSRGCDWVRDYLENSSNVSEEDRKICDGY